MTGGDVRIGEDVSWFVGVANIQQSKCWLLVRSRYCFVVLDVNDWECLYYITFISVMGKKANDYVQIYLISSSVVYTFQVPFRKMIQQIVMSP